MFNLFDIISIFTYIYNMEKTINQQQSSEKENVQRLDREVVAVIGETENTLSDKAEGKDIVHNLRSLSKLKSKEWFLEKALEKYGDVFTYDLTNYSGIAGNKIKITCKIHGEFEKVPHTFLLKNCKTGCKQCGETRKNLSKTKSYSNFIEVANKKHSNKYTYPENEYVNRKSKIKIICPIHGEFIKKAQKHLSGQGCFKCKVNKMVDEGILVGGYCENLFEENPELKDKEAILYYISINNGEYYKVGITRTSVSNRINSLKCSSKRTFKTFEVLLEYKDTLYACFKKEQEILKKFAKDRVYTKVSTELFNKNVLTSLN